MKIPRSLTLAVLGVVATSSGGAAARPCKTDPRVLGDCFRVHGRLGFYNGYPSFRIWRIGTDRILGVQDDEAPIVPDNVATHLSTHTEIFADFVVVHSLSINRDGCGECASNQRNILSFESDDTTGRPTAA